MMRPGTDRCLSFPTPVIATGLSLPFVIHTLEMS
jgi:hypothetical protein